MGTVHTVAVHFRYDYYMRRLANEFLCRNPIGRHACDMQSVSTWRIRLQIGTYYAGCSFVVNFKVQDCSEFSMAHLQQMLFVTIYILIIVSWIL